MLSTVKDTKFLIGVVVGALVVPKAIQMVAARKRG